MRSLSTVLVYCVGLVHCTQSFAYPKLAARDVKDIPAPPLLNFFYTVFAECLNPYLDGHGPAGIRTFFPCTSGNFSGPDIEGTMINGGGDWGTYDTQTGMFSADTRYSIRSTDGALFYVRTSGPQIGGDTGPIHVRVQLETGDAKWYWVNHAIIVGIATPMLPTDIGFTLRLDVYHLAVDPTNTTFINGRNQALEAPHGLQNLTTKFD